MSSSDLPQYVQQNVAHWTRANADYTDKSIKNFRYGPVTFADGGACPKPTGCPVIATNGVQIEYAGKLALPGKPFQVTTANVP